MKSSAVAETGAGAIARATPCPARIAGGIFDWRQKELALSRNDPSLDTLRVRAWFLYIPLFAAFGVIAWRLHVWQVDEGAENVRLAEMSNTVEERVVAPRGRILDRKGRVLAANRPAYNVYVVPKLLPRSGRLWRELRDTFRLTPEQIKDIQASIERSLAGAGSLSTREPIFLKQATSPSENAAFENAAFRFGEIEIQRGEGGSTRASLNVAQFPSRRRVLRDLQEILALENEKLDEIEVRISSLAVPDLGEAIPVKRDIDPKTEIPLLEANAHRLPGVLIKKELLRLYPFGESAAHMVGFMQEMTPAEYKNHRSIGYRLGDMLGRLGAERLYERELRGQDGVEYVIVDARGRRRDDPAARRLITGMPNRAPIPGNDVYLSIDVDLQRSMEEFVRGHPRVALVALDANTGQIRGLVSKPSFDPNTVLKNWKRLLADPAKPMNDRVTQESYFPGSTYKVVAGMGAIELGKVTPHQSFHCSGSLYFGRKFECHRRHGSTDYKHGYMFSCDVYFYNMGLRVGMDAMARFARDLGYGERPGLDLTKEAVGTVPTIAHHKRVSAEGYVRGFDLNTAIGQGEVRVTALQQALAYAAISNGGKLLKPTLLEKIVSADGVSRAAPLVVKRKIHVSERTRRLTHEALTAVMNTPGGTAYFRRSKRIKVGGKTGTAQRRHNIKGKDWERTYEDRDDAWYVAFAPADKPELAVAVLVEHGGHGGATAAPIAVKISERWFELEGKLSPVVAKAVRNKPQRAGDTTKPGGKPPNGAQGPSIAPRTGSPREQGSPRPPSARPAPGVRVTSLGPSQPKASAARAEPTTRRDAPRSPGATP